FGLVVGTGTALHALLHRRARLLPFTALYALLLAFLVYGQPGFVQGALFWIGWHGGVLVPGVLFLCGAVWLLEPTRPRWPALLLVWFVRFLAPRQAVGSGPGAAARGPWEFLSLYFPLTVLATLTAPVVTALAAPCWATTRFFYTFTVPGALLVLSAGVGHLA